MSIPLEKERFLLELSATYSRWMHTGSGPGSFDCATGFVIPFLSLFGWKKEDLENDTCFMPVSSHYSLIPVIFLTYHRGAPGVMAPVFVCEDRICDHATFTESCHRAARTIGAPFFCITSFERLWYHPVHPLSQSGNTGTDKELFVSFSDYCRHYSLIASRIGPMRECAKRTEPVPAVCTLAEFLQQFRRSASRLIVSSDPFIRSGALDLSIQQVIGESLITAIIELYTREESNFSGKRPEKTFLDAIVSSALTPAQPGFYDPKPADMQSPVFRHLVASLHHDLMQDEQGISIAWMQPADLAFALKWSLACQITNAGGSASEIVRRWGNRTPESLFCAGDILLSIPDIDTIIKTILNRGDDASLFDPVCGTGQVALALCSLILQKEAGKEKDLESGVPVQNKKRSIEREYRFLLQNLFMSDPDPAFAQAAQVMLGMFLLYRRVHTAATMPVPEDLIESNRFPVQTGSILFTDDFQSQMLSPYSSHRLLSLLHPIESPQNHNGAGFDAIIAGGFPAIPVSSPDADRYFEVHYHSYQTGSDTGLLWIERAVSLVKPGGHALCITGTDWMRKRTDSSFRRWLCSAGLCSTVYDREETGLCSPPVSALHLVRNRERFTITVVQRKPDTRNNTGSSTPSCFILSLDGLNPDEGWDLQDPCNTRLIKKIREGGIPLERYLLGEWYAGDRLRNHRGFGIVLTHHNDCLILKRYHQSRQPLPSEKPHDAVRHIFQIPADDPYLAGILESSLIGWLFMAEYTRSGMQKEDTSLFTWFCRTIPVPVLDYADESQQNISNTIASLSSRKEYLSQILSHARTYHDRERISRTLAQVTGELNRKVMDLFSLTRTEQDQIACKDRLKNPGTYTTPK